MITEQEQPFIDSLVMMRKNGYGLDSVFYQDPIIYYYLAEMQNIWRSGWLFAGHSCEVPDPGDYFALSIDQDSLIIIRDDNYCLSERRPLNRTGPSAKGYSKA